MHETIQFKMDFFVSFIEAIISILSKHISNYSPINGEREEFQKYFNLLNDIEIIEFSEIQYLSLCAHSLRSQSVWLVMVSKMCTSSE